jgi:Ca-activated chloride channel family protein
MTLLYPWVILLIIPYIYCVLRCTDPGDKTIFSNTLLISSIAGGSKKSHLSAWLKTIAVFLILSALSRPVIEQTIRSSSISGKGYAISLILDASASMNEEHRFEQAKQVLENFVRNRPGDSFGLSVFADFAATSVPVNQDHNATIEAIRHLRIGIAGDRDTALYEALYRGSDALKNASSKNRIAILLTDGLNTVSSIPLRAALAKAQKYHLRIYTIGLGKSYEKPILQKIAEQTGGRFFAISSPKKLSTVYKSIDRLEPSRQISQTYTRHFELYRYLLIIAMTGILLAWYFDSQSNIRKKISHILALSAILGAIVIPQIPSRQIHDSSSLTPCIIGLDLSYFMDAQDIYPNRLNAVEGYLKQHLPELSNQPVGLIGFSDQAYLISPMIHDTQALIYLIEHLDPSVIHRKQTNISSLIKSAAKLFPDHSDKHLILFTSGGDGSGIDTAAKLAKKLKIQVDIYGIGTSRGTVIPLGHDLLRSPDGTPVLSQLQPALKKITLSSGGKYINWSPTAPFASVCQTPGISRNNKRGQRPSRSTIWLSILALAALVSTHIRPPTTRRPKA